MAMAIAIKEKTFPFSLRSYLPVSPYILTPPLPPLCTSLQRLRSSRTISSLFSGAATQTARRTRWKRTEEGNSMEGEWRMRQAWHSTHS